MQLMAYASNGLGCQIPPVPSLDSPINDDVAGPGLSSTVAVTWLTTAQLRQKPPSMEPRSAAAAEAPTSTTPLATRAVPFTTAKRHSSLSLPCTSAYN